MNMGESSDIRINVLAGVVRSQAEDSLTGGDALMLSDHKALLPVLEEVGAAKAERLTEARQLVADLTVHAHTQEHVS